MHLLRQSDGYHSSRYFNQFEGPPQSQARQLARFVINWMEHEKRLGLEIRYEAPADHFRGEFVGEFTWLMIASGHDLEVTAVKDEPVVFRIAHDKT